MDNPIGLDSLCVRDPEVVQHNPPHQVPIVAASSFVFDTIESGIRIFDGAEAGHIYSRFGNPTIDAAAQKIAALESHTLDQSATGLLTSSGMGAISTVLMAMLRPGDAILTQADLYGGTAALMRDLLGPLGVEMIVTDFRQIEAVEAILREREHVRLLYFETPSNPLLRCVDMAALCQLAHQHNVLTVADNTFCTPVLQQPLQFGVDMVIHSTTKYLNGHGTGIAGAIIARDSKVAEQHLLPTLKLTGPNSNPWDAWLVLNGLKTLALRMHRHCDNAEQVARFLQRHPKVPRVLYPGLPDHPDHALAQVQMRRFGGMISFEAGADLASAQRFMNALRFCTLTPTLGDVDSLVLHPATMSHRALSAEVRQEHGITDQLVRISVGVETIEDILSDLEQALSTV